MKKFLLWACLVLIASTSLPSVGHAQEGEAAPRQDSARLLDEALESRQEEKKDIVDELLEMNPIEEQIQTKIEEVAMRVPKKDQEIFIETLQASIDMKLLMHRLRGYYNELYTFEELKFLKDLYEDPRYETIRIKERKLRQQISPVVRSMIQGAVFELQSQGILSPENLGQSAPAAQSEGDLAERYRSMLEEDARGSPNGGRGYQPQ